jgi:hypothetical protein
MEGESERELLARAISNTFAFGDWVCPAQRDGQEAVLASENTLVRGGVENTFSYSAPRSATVRKPC